MVHFNTTKCHIVSISRKRNKPKATYFLGTERLKETESFSYLGVMVSSDLRWNGHIKNICTKATHTLNFIRRNIHKCTPEAKAKAYLTLIRPQLEYASPVWDPYTNKLREEVEKVQRRAARFVKNNYKRTSSVSEMLTDLGWTSLSARRRSARLILFYKAVHNLTAIPIDHLQRPTRNTRYSGENTFTVIPAKIDAYKYSFFPRSVVEWNSLSEFARLQPSIDEFRRQLQ